MFAPAGEVIKIEMSEEDMDATGGILVHIGQALYNKKANNIWPAKNVNRMPVILNSMKVNKSTATYDEKTKTYTAYVGSFLGGPIYIHNTSVATNVKVSGGVRYTHFIHGYTTEEEFKENAKSSAPYFDLEVWDGGVLHSGPKSCAGMLQPARLSHSQANRASTVRQDGCRDRLKSTLLSRQALGVTCTNIITTSKALE